MNKFKKILCAGLTVIMALSVAACGKDSSEKPESTQSGTKQIVKFAVLEAGYGRKPYEELAKAYMEKNPDVQIKLVFDPEINSNVDLEIDGSNAISDVYSIRDLTKIKMLGALGKVLDLTPMLNSTFGEDYEEAGATVRSNMDQAMITKMTYFNKVYCVPEYTSVNGFVYNKSLFDEHGWTIPSTTAELETLCKKILADTNGKVAPIVFCEKADGYLYFAVDNWLDQYAGIANLDEFYAFGSKELFNPNSEISKGKKLAHENLLKFFTEIGENIDAPLGYAMNSSVSITHLVAQSYLIEGKAAMMLNGSWFENEMSTKLALPEYADLELGMFPLPAMSDARGNVQRAIGYTSVDDKVILDADYGAYYMIPTKAKNKDGAIDFLRFLSSDEACVIYTKYTNAPRPFNYNTDTSTADYADMKSFGKSIIDLAHNCYMYAPISTNLAAVNGEIDLYPKQGYWTFKMINDPATYTIESILKQDYDYVCAEWDRLVEEYM